MHMNIVQLRVSLRSFFLTLGAFKMVSWFGEMSKGNSYCQQIDTMTEFAAMSFTLSYTENS